MNTDEAIVSMICKILERKGRTLDKLEMVSSLYSGGIGLDSLDVAELSMRLEQTLGKDPFTQGCFPHTLEELLAFYHDL